MQKEKLNICSNCYCTKKDSCALYINYMYKRTWTDPVVWRKGDSCYIKNTRKYNKKKEMYE